jgi:hypothetical protein
LKCERGSAKKDLGCGIHFCSTTELSRDSSVVELVHVEFCRAMSPH